MVTNITTIEADDKFWINIDVDGLEMAPRGPFDSDAEAQVVAAQLGAICRTVLRQPVHIGAMRQPAAKQRQRDGHPGERP